MKESGFFDLKSKLANLNRLTGKKTEDTEQPLPLEVPEEEPRQKNKVWEVIRILGLAVYRLRALFMAIPVIFAALRLAAYNSEHLPLLVGLDLQTTGEYARMISRQTAVSVPVMITAACLVLTLFSRKMLYPWLISVFSLVIPILQVGIPAVLSLYFDFFSGAIQALVFCMLSMVYIGAANPPHPEKEQESK